MSSNPTIPSENLSTEIVLNMWRDGLRTAASDSGEPLIDPHASERPSDSKFILTSYPSSGVFYPLVVVEEFDDSSDRIDGQADLFAHDGYAIRVSIYARSNTNLYKIRDQIRHFVESNYVNHMREGFAESTIESSTAASWENNPEVQKWEMVISGLVHTSV